MHDSQFRIQQCAWHLKPGTWNLLFGLLTPESCRLEPTLPSPAPGI